jgi:NADPH2:quinone reductase
MAVRAAVVTRFGGPEVIETKNLPVPSAGPGEVVVDMELADIIFVETQIRRGMHGGFFDVAPPYVPGSSIGGRVRAVGADVDPGLIGWAVVGRTVNWGGHAEQAVMAADALIDVPAGLGLREAVAVFDDGRRAAGGVRRCGR